MDVFDVSERTIIKATESVGNGAEFLGAYSGELRKGEAGREDCQAACCRTSGCNIAVLQETSDRDCFLFDCGSVEDFRCKFSVHDNYVAMGMRVDRVQLQKSLIHEQSRHAVDLSVMKEKESPAQSRSDSGRDPPPPPPPRERERPRPRPPPPPAPPPRRSDTGDVRKSGRETMDSSRSVKLRPVESERAACQQRYEWRCGSGECIPVYDVCTGVTQCVDGSDEDSSMCRKRLENIRRHKEDEAKNSAVAVASSSSSSSSSSKSKDDPPKTAPAPPHGKANLKGGEREPVAKTAASASETGTSGKVAAEVEKVGLAGMVLILGLLLLLIFLLFVCCRLRTPVPARPAPRRRRQGKMRDSEEGDLLINGLPL